MIPSTIFSKLLKISACIWGTTGSTHAPSYVLLSPGQAFVFCNVLRSKTDSGPNWVFFAEPAPVVGFRRFEDKESFLRPESWGIYGVVSRFRSAECSGQ